MPKILVLLEDIDFERFKIVIHVYNTMTTNNTDIVRF